MFQRLDELQTGSLYILTGQAGAGKSHLAVSARRGGGTLWILDTEGAAQNLQGKTGIHRKIQAVQTLSLRSLIQAMEEIKTNGKVGDTVVLDSISKVFQAMRSYAQQRAGAETNQVTAINHNEHASVNRNMQAVYTALTELKQAGFHVIIIGHLARKYSSKESGLQDEGLRVMADDTIAYEADAILLVERNGEERSVTPIIKPPRPAHLKMNKQYPASLATLYPDQVPEEAKPKKGKASAAQSEPVSEAVAPVVEDEPELDEVDEAQAESAPAQPAARSAAAPTQPPRDAAEAEQRFFARYGKIVGGNSWNLVQRYLGDNQPKPSTVEGWISVAEAVRDLERGSTSAITA